MGALIMIAISKKLGILTLAMGAVLGGDALVGNAWAGTLDDIRQSKTLRLAYREEAKPFAYKTPAHAWLPSTSPPRTDTIAKVRMPSFFEIAIMNDVPLLPGNNPISGPL